MRLVQPRPLRRVLQKPPALKAGDTVAIVAPASPPLKADVINRARAHFETLGFKVLVGANAGARNGYLAGTDKERLADVRTVLSRKSVKAVLCVRGGYGVGRILSSIPFSSLRASPKIVVGCSDVTALLHGALVEGGTTVFHGPMVQSLMDPECPEYTWDSFLCAITKRDAALGSILLGYEHSAKTVAGVRRGRVTGPLVGGNLTILLSLLGTRFFPSLKGAIVCLEEVGEMPYRVDRMLTQLLSVGAFDSVAGFALGVFKDCEYPAPREPRHSKGNVAIRDVVIDRLHRLGKPIVMGLPFGHVAHNATLPLGALATLNGTTGDLVIEEHGVR